MLQLEYHGKFEGTEIFSVVNENGRVLFQGGKEECLRYIPLHRQKVKEMEERIRASQSYAG